MSSSRAAKRSIRPLIFRARGIPFAFFTAYDREVLGPKYARETVIEKPFSRTELEKCVLGWIESKEASLALAKDEVKRGA